jgi:hypothetical protein
VGTLSESAARDARRAALVAMDLDDATEMPPFKKIRPGLMTLAQRVHERERGEFDRFRRRWRRSRVEKAVAQIAAVARRSSLATAER